MQPETGRRLAVPLVLVGVTVWGVLSAASAPAPPPPARPALVEDPAPPLATGPEPAVVQLWEAWRQDLAVGPDPVLPVEVGSLGLGEALYVLLSVRASQLAEAVERAGTAAADADGVAAAALQAGLAPTPPEVSVDVLRTRPLCLALRHESEPFGRSYFAAPGLPPEPGPPPTSPLEEALLAAARVGLVEVDAGTCGQPVAYSPAAQDALAALDPVLLTR